MVKQNKFVIFACEGEEYGIPVEQVISIEKLESIQPVPNMPEYVLGIVDIRGELIPVIDIRTVFYDRKEKNDDQSRLIVVKTDQLSIALFVKDVKELLDVASEQIKQPGLKAYQKTAYFSGVISLDERLILMVDAQQLAMSLEGIQEIARYLEEEAAVSSV